MSLIDPGWFEKLSIKQRLYVVIIGLIGLVLLVSLVIWIFSGGGTTKKEKDLGSNIDRQIGVNSVIGNLVANQQEAVNNAANNTNRALNILRNSDNIDSSVLTGNSEDKFCQRFPNDSTCEEWRLRHR